LAAGWALAGQERLVDWTGRSLRVVATLWMAWALAGLLWLLGGHGSVPLSAPPPAPRREAPTVDVGQLASLDLFGAPPVATAGGIAADAPDTTLQLRLAGVFVSGLPADSSAIVAERNNPAAPVKSYRINDTLPGGAVLAEVHDDRILIRRGQGAAEVLRFEKTGLLEGGNAAQAGLGGRGIEADDRADEAVDVRAALDNAIMAMGRNPDAFVQQFGLKPGPLGYEITDMTPEDLRGAIGLQPGDRILSVNGRRLGNPRQDQEVLTALKASGAARVEVQRGGQIVTIERKF
jgi:general secretion pathway protein C